ncbi:MAG TPA: hypothetical protein PKY30_17510 [Myxococcota bacterium]|nr:hypothetical protein [Myxococcota bacterium]
MPLRVLLALHQGGGAGSVNSTLALGLGLRARGVDARLVCPPGSPVEAEARAGGLPVHPLPLALLPCLPSALPSLLALLPGSFLPRCRWGHRRR